MRLPDFFIVGAPKCGTSALHDFLDQHPDVFLPAWEPSFFGSDLRFLRPRPLDDYAAMFARAVEPIVGEKSVLYLLSERAAAEIAAMCPEARIIAMLRNPVDMMHAWHGEALWSRQEDIRDFAEALAAEPDRAAGRRIPKHAGVLDATRYRDLARYAPQLRRYLDVFGEERVLILVYEEFFADLAAGYRSTLRFLGARPSFVPEFRVVNPAKAVRSRAVAGALAFAARRVAPRLGLRPQPPGTKRRLTRLYERIARANSRVAPRPPLSPELRARLLEELEPEVDAVERLLGRSLPAWRR